MNIVFTISVDDSKIPDVSIDGILEEDVSPEALQNLKDGAINVYEEIEKYNGEES